MEGQVDKDQLWRAVSGELGVSLSPGSYLMFIKPCAIGEVDQIDEERLLVQVLCPSGYIQQNIDERYYGQIRKIIETQTGKQIEIAFKVDPTLINKKPEAKESAGSIDRRRGIEKVDGDDKVGLFESTNKWEDEEKEELRRSGMNPKFSFDNFVVGNTNNLAYAAAKGIVDSPGSKHNPMFIWGGVGVGKTHLMHAVGRAMREKGYKNVMAITSEQFTNDLVGALRSKRMDDFKKKYRNVDALMIDDVQFFAGKDSSQQELFHTFNELYQKEKQIILTADRRPQEIEIDQRLGSRFVGGLTVDIGLPDYEMRLAILKQKCKEKGIEASEDALDLLASKANTNSRELEGHLMRLSNMASLRGNALTSELVETETGIKAKKLEKHLRPQEVISLVARLYDYKNKDLIGTSRKAELVRARHVTIYLLRKEMGMTLERVAEMMGNRDHTTIMHAVEKVEREFGINQELREQVMRAKQAIYK